MRSTHIQSHICIVHYYFGINCCFVVQVKLYSSWIYLQHVFRQCLRVTLVKAVIFRPRTILEFLLRKPRASLVLVLRTSKDRHSVGCSPRLTPIGGQTLSSVWGQTLPLTWGWVDLLENSINIASYIKPERSKIERLPLEPLLPLSKFVSVLILHCICIV